MTARRSSRGERQRIILQRGLRSGFDQVISAEDIKTNYKPAITF
jgi:hypothetical protein